MNDLIKNIFQNADIALIAFTITYAAFFFAYMTYMVVCTMKNISNGESYSIKKTLGSLLVYLVYYVIFGGFVIFTYPVQYAFNSLGMTIPDAMAQGLTIVELVALAGAGFYKYGKKTLTKFKEDADIETVEESDLELTNEEDYVEEMDLETESE